MSHGGTHVARHHAPARRRSARGAQRDSNAVLMALLSIGATGVAIYDLVLLLGFAG
jgi:hypothetical protein